MHIVAYVTDLNVSEFGCPATVEKLERQIQRTELNARYVLIATSDLPAAQALLDGARVIAQNEILIVYELHRQTNSP
jgi:hypothetical protein